MAADLSPEKMLLARPLLDRIRARRKAQGLTTLDAAARLACNHTTYRNFETGAFRALRAEKLLFWIRFLGLDEVETLTTLAAIDERLVLDTGTQERIKTASLLAAVWDRMNSEQMTELRALLRTVLKQSPQPSMAELANLRLTAAPVKLRNRAAPKLRKAS